MFSILAFPVECIGEGSIQKVFPFIRLACVFEDIEYNDDENESFKVASSSEQV